MTQADPRVGQVVTRRNGKKYIFEGLNEDGTWRVTPVGSAEAQSGWAGFGRTLAQGATFGFSDEISGALGAIGKGTYEESRDQARENLAQYREEHPALAFGAEALGGLATGILGPAALAARGTGAGLRGVSQASGLLRGGSAAGRTARAAEVAGGLGKGGTATSKMLQAGKLGALEGGVYGVGAGGEARGATLDESVKSRLGSGAAGAAFGGLLGAGMAGGLAAGARGIEFGRGLRAGRLGTGGTAQIGKELDDAAAAALPDSGSGGLVETGGSAAVAGDDAAAFGLVELERAPDPKAFSAKAKEWLSKTDKSSPEYQTYLDSGQSEYYAATMQLAKDALEKEGAKGVVPGLLADRTKRHRATATLAARTTEGPEAGLLEVATARPESVTRALDEVQPAFGERAFEAPGSARTIERLTEEGRELAQDSYDAVYHLDPAVRRAIHGDKTYQGVIERMTRAFGSGGGEIPGMGEAFARARRAAVAAAEEAGNTVKANKLRRVNTFNLLGRFEKTTTGQLRYREPNVGALTRAGGPESLDILRRTLEEIKEGMMREGSEATNVKLGYTMKKFIAQLDDAVAGVPGAGLFDDARAGYAGRRGIKEAYEDAPNIIKKSRESVKAYVDGLKKRGKDVPIEIGTNDAGTTVRRSELDMFKQRVLDDFVDKMDVEGVAAPKEIARLRRDFNKLFGGEKPILDASGADVKRIAQNLDQLAKQAKLSKQLAEMPSMPATADLEGMVEATAFGYALAGQPGAAARTGLASTVYGPGRWENVGSAMARRLRQTEGQGLLNLAETIGRTEGDKALQLTRRQALSGATPGLLGGTREELEGGRYLGYRPNEARRRRMREEQGR